MAMGIGYRTYPGTHPDKGSYFTRGSSHDEFAAYTEDGDVYARVMERIARKFETALEFIPQPEITSSKECNQSGLKLGLLFYGTTASAIKESTDSLARQNLHFDTVRIKAFPFHDSVNEFIEQHDYVFVIEQNRDAQMKSLLQIECGADNNKLVSILSYNGVLITAQHIENVIMHFLDSLSDADSEPVSTQAT